MILWIYIYIKTESSYAVFHHTCFIEEGIIWLKGLGTPWLPKSLHYALQSLEKVRSIQITDHGSGQGWYKVVVMDKSTYDTKIENLLDDVQTNEKLNDNPLVKVN